MCLTHINDNQHHVNNNLLKVLVPQIRDWFLVLDPLTYHLLDFFFPLTSDKWMSWISIIIVNKGTIGYSTTLGFPLSPSSLFGMLRHNLSDDLFLFFLQPIF